MPGLALERRIPDKSAKGGSSSSSGNTNSNSNSSSGGGDSVTVAAVEHHNSELKRILEGLQDQRAKRPRGR